MAYPDHSSGLPDAYDRTSERPEWARVIFREGRLAQAAEMNEAQTIIEGRARRVADRVMTDGNRISGAEIIVDSDAETVTLTPGQVYARGDVRALPAATLTDIPMSGEVVIGIRIVSSVITEVEDPDLVGLAPGTVAEGEPGAARQAETAVWGWGGDGEDGDLYQVYLLKDGAPVDQTRPANLSDVSQALALYDRDAHGSYVVRGCRVKALGRIGGAQHFSIAEGVANINGFKRTRAYALRHVEAEAFDIAEVDAEPQTFADAGSGTAVITLNRGPLAALDTAIITKQRTVTLIKGLSGSLDLLPDDSVSTIVSVVQGGTTYTPGADYILTADQVDWTPGGAEPASGSSYDVTYRYLDQVTPDAMTDDTVTLSGGVTGSLVLLSYSWKLPRTDLLCLDEAGLPVYVKGVSTPAAPRAPAQPTALLALAEVRNDWRGTPEIVNTDVRSVPYDELWTYIRKLFDALDLVALERLKSDIDAREPVAKKGVFTDPWDSDFYRDQGEAQTAAAFGGELRLAIVPTIHNLGPFGAALLDWTTEYVVAQELITGCMKINPYQNFDPLPAQLAISPATDFWTVFDTQWTSAITEEVTATRDFRSGSAPRTRTELVSERREVLQFLRQISVSFTINGFGAGEVLQSLTFDGLNVTPPGLVANGSGTITGSFTIPANVPAGTKTVEALGGSGRRASAIFSGQGVVEIDVIRQINTVAVQPRPQIREEGRNDPLAQTFTLTESRFVTGFDLRVCAIGDTNKPLVVEMRSVENGIPTAEILAQVVVPMTGALPGGWWVYPRFAVPVFAQAGREFALVVKTDDANHALSVATIGQFDPDLQRFASAQPYSVGVLLSSSNASTWTPEQGSDLTFRVAAARFAPVEKTVTLGTFPVVSMSDVLIRPAVELATGDCSVVFEVVRADGSVTRLLGDQPWELSEYVSETITVRAVLRGTERVTPILYPGNIFIAGSLAASGTYVTRAFTMGSAIRMSAFIKTFLPAGSTLTVEIDAANDVWTAVTQHAATVLDGGWVEREFRRTPYTATQGRLRLTITGTPAARPRLADMRAVAI